MRIEVTAENSVGDEREGQAVMERGAAGRGDNILDRRWVFEGSTR
jgi:hypothetical protein